MDDTIKVMNVIIACLFCVLCAFAIVASSLIAKNALAVNHSPMITSRQVANVEYKSELKAEPERYTEPVSRKAVAFVFCGGSGGLPAYLCGSAKAFSEMLITKGVDVYMSNSDSSPDRRAFLANMLKYAAGHETVYVYISAHGYDGGFCIPCVESTDKSRNIVTYRDIARILRRIEKSGASKIVIVIDACHSGSAVEEMARSGRTIIASSGKAELSYAEAEINRFTKHFTPCMMASFDALRCVQFAAENIPSQRPAYWSN